MDIIGIVFLVVCFFIALEGDRQTCNTCWKQGEAQALASQPYPFPPVVIVPQSEIYSTDNGHLTKLGNVMCKAGRASQVS